MKYPPFCDIILISFNSLNEDEIIKASNFVYEYLKQKMDDEFNIFRPVPSPIDKIQNRYRWRIIIKGNISKKANDILNETLKEVYNLNLKFTRIAIDVNPNNMM